MASVVDICNTALVEISADYITSLEDDSKAAKLCNSVYTQCRDSLLREHTWNFAKARRTLARLTETPAFGFTYQYQLPTDCLKFLWFDEDYEGRILYQIEGRVLLTNEPTANILYIKQIEDPTLHDALFNEVLAYRIAARIGYNLTGNQSIKATMANAEKMAMSTAKSINAQELNEQREERSNWIDSRQSGRDYSMAGS